MRWATDFFPCHIMQLTNLAASLLPYLWSGRNCSDDAVHFLKPMGLSFLSGATPWRSHTPRAGAMKSPAHTFSQRPNARSGALLLLLGPVLAPRPVPPHAELVLVLDAGAVQHAADD